MYTVRIAEERDIPALLRLLLQVDMVHHAGRPDLFAGPATKYDAKELEALLRADGHRIFVCVDGDGNVAGHAFCELREQKGNAVQIPRRTLYIDDICVDAGHRRQGVGTLLFQRAKRLAEEEDCYRVTLNVWSFNGGAMAFYQSLGMEPLCTTLETVLGEKKNNPIF